MRKYLKILFLFALTLSFTACGQQNESEQPTNQEETSQTGESGSAMKAGTYTAQVAGMQGPLTVELTVDETGIKDAKITESQETPGIGNVAAERLAKELVDFQSLDLDTVSGATITSAAVKKAFKDCLEQAGANMDALEKERERDIAIEKEYTADVVIVGAGGAGLTAASAALENGASVLLLEKMDIVGGNSIVVGGFMNAPIPELQDHKYEQRQPSIDRLVEQALEEEPVSEEHKALQDAVREEYEAYLADSSRTLFDSANWFALQTWNAGDKVGELPIVEKMTAHAYDRMQWLISNGMEFKDEVVLGGGALYTRSRYAVMPNGTGYIKAIEDSIAKNNKDNYQLLLGADAKELILDGEKVVGVKAIINGQEVVAHANKGVVLATGGFAGNVELRVKYAQGEKWPNLGKDVLTTNTKGVTGDGIFMAESAGAELVNMEQIQLLPYCNPMTGQVNDTFGGGDGSTIFINKEGKRFVREDGRRDEMSKAIIEQTDGIMYMFSNLATFKVQNAGDIKTLGGQKVSYFLENNLNGIIVADTLEEFAEKFGCPVENLKETLESYNEHVKASTEDEFGRVTFVNPLEEGPFVAYPRKPSAHHTMGGVRIDAETHALRSDGSIIPGLYCAGEITGVIHGANRVGGNAIVDYLTFGYEAGQNAAAGK
uniref:FAD-dependent oxidoreductase n=1 Tax=Ndongobacter massiliensis TaxID=1871025 RepID=UPI0009317052|nr:FAD-dependent oxidoreductase [Ndongobacter massiliensis]